MLCAAAALQRLARDLSSEAPSERESAVALLSSLTVFLEHHPALLDAGVLPALMRTVTDPETIPQASLLLQSQTQQCITCHVHDLSIVWFECSNDQKR